MIHVDIHRAYFHAQAKPNTYVEVPDGDQPEAGKVCGCLVKEMYGTRQAASAWEEEVKKAMRKEVFDQRDVDGSGFAHGDDSVIVTRRWHAKEIEKHSRRKWNVAVQTFGPGYDDELQVRILKTES